MGLKHQTACITPIRYPLNIKTQRKGDCHEPKTKNQLESL